MLSANKRALISRDYMRADPAGGLTGRGDTRREEEAALNPVTAGESLQRRLVTLRLDFYAVWCVCVFAPRSGDTDI